MGPQGPAKAFSGAGPVEAVRPPPETRTLADDRNDYRSIGSDGHLVMRPLKADNGLSHSGDPEEEVIVLEEPIREESGPRVVRVPRVPT